MLQTKSDYHREVDLRIEERNKNVFFFPPQRLLHSVSEIPRCPMWELPYTSLDSVVEEKCSVFFLFCVTIINEQSDVSKFYI